MPPNIFRLRGCPGAGLDKSTRLAQYAREAVAAYGPTHVAIASLTRTAANEIAGRDTLVPEQNVGTLHRHCYHALDQPDLAETTKSLREFAAAHPGLVGDDRSRDQGADDTTGGGGALHAAAMNHRAAMTPIDQWTDLQRDYHAAWTDYKHQHHTLDFSDLIEQCLHEPHPARPRGLFLDEAQDFSRLELTLAMRWAQDAKTTVLAADVDQAIYGWRGADPAALQALPVQKDILLDQSYRCSRAVTDLAQHWISQLDARRPFTWTARDADGSVHAAPFALRDTDDVVALALDSIDAEQTTMILASCRYMLSGLVAQLRRDGVPFENPWADEPEWNPLQSAGTRALLAFLRPDPGTWGTEHRMWTWGDLHAWTEPMQATRFQRGAKASIAEHCRVDDFGVTHAHAPVDLGTLITLIGETAAEAALNLDTEWWESALLARGTRSSRYPLAVLATRGGPALRAAPLLTVGSVHSVKGGEAGHVIVAPEMSKEAYWGADGWLAGGRGRDAAVRQFYVALTRARENLTILEPGITESVPLEQYVRETAA